jgi:hypothetical protein
MLISYARQRTEPRAQSARQNDTFHPLLILAREMREKMRINKCAVLHAFSIAEFPS